MLLYVNLCYLMLLNIARCLHDLCFLALLCICVFAYLCSCCVSYMLLAAYCLRMIYAFFLSPPWHRFPLLSLVGHSISPMRQIDIRCFDKKRHAFKNYLKQHKRLWIWFDAGKVGISQVSVLPWSNFQWRCQIHCSAYKWKLERNNS